MINLVKIKDKNNKYMLDGGDIYIPAFNQKLQDLLIKYSNVFTTKSLPTDVEELKIKVDELVSQVRLIDSIQRSLVYALENDYKAIIPWVYYSWSDIPEAYIPTVIQAHYSGLINIADYWQIGDIREYDNGENKFYYTIVDFNKDQLETPINNHTTSAITLFVTTNNELRPCCDGSSSSDWTHGFGPNVNTDLTEFIEFLEYNAITDSYFNTANNIKTIVKEATYIPDYNDSFKYLTLTQKIHVPNYLELTSEYDRERLLDPAYYHNQNSRGIHIKDLIKEQYNSQSTYALFQKNAFEKFITSDYNGIIPYFEKRHGNYSSITYYTNCTLRDTSNDDWSEYTGDYYSYRFKMATSYEDILNYNESSKESNSDFGVLIINI